MSQTKKPVVLLIATVLLIAWNLRIAPVMVGPVLPELSAELGMSATLAGFLTSLPTLCFAVFGLLTPLVEHKLGLHWALWLALFLNASGQVVRNLSTGPWVFLAGTVIALAGIAIVNILMPSLIKRHFPDKPGIVTAVYTTTQATSTMITGFATAPLALQLGGWQGPFWLWAAIGIVSLTPITVAAFQFKDDLKSKRETISFRRAAKTKLPWMLAIFFGAQSAQAYAIFGWLPSIYQSAGFDSVAAGGYLTIFNLVAVPITFIVPVWTQRTGKPAGIVIASAIFLMSGFAGLIYSPATLPWLWPLLLACGSGCFSLILILVATKTHTSAGITVLSSFGQSVGYILASFGPLLMGFFNELTGAFTAALTCQFLITIPLLLAGLYCAKARVFEEELAEVEAKAKN